MSNENKTISWKAREFKHYPKNAGWYVILTAGAILVIAFFIFVEKDIFAAVSLGLIALLIAFFSTHKPEEVQIELNSKGVRFGQLLYPYKQLKYFWLVQDPNHKTVNFHTSALLNSILILELEGQNGEEVRQYLLQYLYEHVETQPTSAQKIMHKFKF